MLRLGLILILRVVGDPMSFAPSRRGLRPISLVLPTPNSLTTVPGLRRHAIRQVVHQSDAISILGVACRVVETSQELNLLSLPPGTTKDSLVLYNQLTCIPAMQCQYQDAPRTFAPPSAGSLLSTVQHTLISSVGCSTTLIRFCYLRSSKVIFVKINVLTY